MTQDVKITCPNVSGLGTELTVDGEKLDLITRIQVDIGVSYPNRIRIDRMADSLDIEGKFEVDEIITLTDRPGKRFRIVEVE